MQSVLPSAIDSRGKGGVSAGLAVIMFLYCVISCIGITWGLPSRKIDKFLFGENEAWTGEKIYRLAKAGEKFSGETRSRTGADVDFDSIDSQGRKHGDTKGVLLTGTEEDVAKIYLRYRLYTYQPDEMITMMALAGMSPGEMSFDPRLYQYGGLFIYPVGALIKLSGLLGLIEVRSDLAYYLDNPDEFGKFYVVARAYSAAWGLVGVVIVFAVTRRLALAIRTPTTSGQRNDPNFVEGSSPTASGQLAGLLAALLFVLMPVVVCMAHEGKPHLPGAVLMLLAVYLAMRALPTASQSINDNRRFFWLTCLACGAAVGMVLSSWPICVLIPLTAFLRFRNAESNDRRLFLVVFRTVVGVLAAIAVYFATNPYVLINLFSNRGILRSNFGNSLAMYEISRIGEGFARVLELTVEGASLPIVALGIVALVIAIIRLRHVPQVWLAILPAAIFFAQFVFIGAGKPAEYGRFGIFTNSIFAVAGALLLSSIWAWRVLGAVIAVPVFAWIAIAGGNYIAAFHRDAEPNTTRTIAAQVFQSKKDVLIAVPVEPAPYSCPPLDFSTQHVVLTNEEELPQIPNRHTRVYIDPRRQKATISWASKWITIDTGPPYTWTPPFEKDHD